MRPGIPGRPAGRDRTGSTFNEAQAMRPGIPGGFLLRIDQPEPPSMRPRPCGPGYPVKPREATPALKPSMRPRPCGPGYTEKGFRPKWQVPNLQ